LKSVADLAGSLARTAAANDEYEGAFRLLEIGMAAARQAKDYSAAWSLMSRKKDLEALQAAYVQYKQAAAVLKKSPGDPDANLAVGRYLCVKKLNWEKGLPMLALGSDPALKSLAERETKGVDSPDARAALGDAWWDSAQTKEGPEKDAFLLRARAWYRQALSGGVSGLLGARLEERLKEIARIEASSLLKPPPAAAPLDEKRARELQESWARYLGFPVKVTNSIGMKLVLIPPGEFDMGSGPEEMAWAIEKCTKPGESRWLFDRVRGETPRHRVGISRAFHLGACEVTQAEYLRVMGDNPSSFSAKGKDSRKVVGQDTSRHPVEMVSWEEAAEFCRRLSALPKEVAARRVYRLPTEAEWEHACRAGSTGKWCFGDVPAKLGEYAWFSGNSGGMTHPVGQKKPNAWGLYDMHGNVWEWCSDWFGQDFYAHSPPRDPIGLPAGFDHVVRGGAAFCHPHLCRCAFRRNSRPFHRFRDFGFRVVVGHSVGVGSDRP
jgi:formylglycine-generating enzyme required for sulfatase activity